MQDPVRYENNKSVAKDIVDVFVPKLIDALEWKIEENVLDYGCGAGSTGYQYILPKVQEFNSKMYSVDVSAKMVAYAKENYSHGLINYGVGDILDKFPFEGVKFDKIFSVNVFHYIKDIRKALAGLHKILKPDGKIYFIMVSAKVLGFQVMKQFAEAAKWKPYMKKFEKFYPQWSEFTEGQEHNEMKQILESSGFLVREMEFHERSYYYNSITTLLEVILAGNPCIDDIPKNLHEEFKEDVRKYLTDSAGIPVESKTYDYPYQLIWGVIEKADNNSNQLFHVCHE